MRNRAITRFRLILLGVVILAGVAFLIRSPGLFAADVIVFLAIMAWGVFSPRPQLFGPFICRAKTEKQCVAITFDDGPDPRSTPQLLELLHQRRIEAAFFCIGRNVAAYPQLAGQMLREGHLLENHTFNHSASTNLFSVNHLKDEMSRTQDAIRHATGVAPRFFRPPMGFSNPRVFRAAHSLGLQVVGWSARAFDTRVTDPQRIVARIARNVRPGAIILLHDGNVPPDRLLHTVKTLLDRLHLLGYEVVRLDRMLP